MTRLRPCPFQNGQTTHKQLLLQLDDEDDDEFEQERDRIERRAEREIRQALDNQFQAVFPEDFDPHAEALAIQQRLAEERKLQEAIRRALRESVDLGVRFGIAHLDTISFGFDWTLAHVEAREYADEFAGLLIRDINTTTLRRVQNAITTWIDSGEALEALIEDLEPIFGRDRSELIASTETTRAYARGSELVYRQSGVVEQIVWRTSNDERVCPICAPLGGLIYSEDGSEPASHDEQQQDAARARLGESFLHPGGEGAAGRFEGRAYDLPPAHPRCRCWITGIV